MRHGHDDSSLLSLVSQIKWIYPYAMTTDKPGAEGEEVPFRLRRRQHAQCIDIQLVKQVGQFIHQGNIYISLRVLDDLCCLRHSLRGRFQP